LSRQVPRGYIPGTPIEVVITIYCDAPDPNYPVTAIGLYEMLPADWTFTSTRGITTEPPPIAPAEGTAGTLQFAWITPPGFPCTFAYTVQVPEDSVGVKTISGQVEYRTNGPRLVSPPQITEINGIDRTPPEITLLGDNPFIIYQGTAYREPGYKAQDNADGDITSRVQVSGHVDTNQPGEYTITYTVRDNAGNDATTTRLVRVLERDTQTPSPGGIVVPPVSGGSGVRPPSVPTTFPNRPNQTAGNQQPIQNKTNIPSSTNNPQIPRPEEVTFPRPSSQKDGQPQGIASGKSLNPFEIPKEIRGGAKPPPNFEKNKIPVIADRKISGKEFSESSENTSSITTAPKTDNIEEKDKKGFTVVATPETTPPVTSTGNTDTLATAPIKMDTDGTQSSFPFFLGSFVDWWSNKTQAERRNLTGMLVLLGMLTLLCLITGKNAYQGIAPQPRIKKTETSKTESGVES